MKNSIKLPYWNHNTVYYPWIKKYIPVNAHVLDVGCGDGTLSYYLSDRAKEVDGLDSFAPVIEKAKVKYNDIPNLHFVCNTFEEYTVTKTYDVIIFAASLHHMDLKSAICKAKSLLRDHGILLVVGLASPSGIADYLVEFLRIIPSAVISHIHRMKTSEDIGVPTSYKLNTMDEIRRLTMTELPEAKTRYGLHYRYLLRWLRKEYNER